MEHISKYLTIQNSELQLQESKQLKTSDEQVFELAIREPKIMYSDRSLVSALLKFLMIKVGIRSQNMPVQEEFDVLVSHVYENFGGHTLSEVRLAFEMAIGDKLELKDGANSFENFSCIYFSNIMKAYRKWATQVPIPVELPKNQRFYSDEELDDFKREDAERQYQMYLRGYELSGTEINKEILKKDSLINEMETVTAFFVRKKEEGYMHIYKPV